MRKTPRTLGTLSITFGAVVAIFSPLSLLMGAFVRGMGNLTSALPKQPGMRDPAIDFGAAQAIFEAQGGYMKVNALVMTAMSIALVVIGVGLLKRRRWSRAAALGWSGLALAFLLAQSIAFFTWLQPTMNAVRDAYYQAHDVPPPPQLQQAAGSVGAVLGWMFYAAYPLVMLVLLGRKSAAEDFVD
jgi:hypothetical protein